MSKLSFFVRCSVLIIFFLNFNRLSAQNFEPCGAVDLSSAEYQELFNNLGPLPAGSGSITFNLPIWINVVQSVDPGWVVWPGFINWRTEIAPMQLLGELNGYFSTTNIQFHLCGVSVIKNDDLLDCDITTEKGALLSQAQQQNPDYE